MLPNNRNACHSIPSRTIIIAGIFVAGVLSIPTIFISDLLAAPAESDNNSAEVQPDSRATHGRSPEALEATAAAKETYEAFCDYSKKGIGHAEDLMTWSQRWCAAEMESAKSPKDVLAAAKAHLKRMIDFQATVNEQYNSGRSTMADYSASRYFVAQAKLQVQKAESAAKK